MNSLAGTPTQPWRYPKLDGCFDEMFDASGAVRAHWEPLRAGLEAMGPEGLESRWSEGRRLIHDNGVTYNAYGEPGIAGRPWPMDPVPLLIGPEDWRFLEAAMIQRARLFNAILADLYGAQTLVRRRVLPAELVLGNPAFLRSVHGVEAPGGMFLHVYSADVARSADGRWHVLADRTQAPSGAGYALENRIVSLRVLPDLFAAARTSRLAAYFEKYRDTLVGLAPRHRDNPRIVLLTPGPFSEAYFEHSFLARYLGFTMVEGADLLVRDEQVYLKTLSGLLPVDVILRRQNDSYSDPLELRADSILGVPGLMQAVRAGTVAVANAIGSGLADGSMLAPFTGRLCRELLGEDLQLASAATEWLGDPDALARVTEALQSECSLVMKPAMAGGIVEPVFTAGLSRLRRAELAKRLSARPGRFLAQREIPLSAVPVWTGSGLAARHASIRLYATASGDSYRVMPGGLARVSGSAASLVVSVQKGGGSKDVWAVTGELDRQVSLLRPAPPPVDVSRATFDLPSRAADNLFWLGRYVERLEAGSRMLRAALLGLIQESNPFLAASRPVVLDLLAASGLASSGLSEPALVRQELLSLLYDPGRQNGVSWNALQVRRLGGLLRDRLSSDAWRVLHQLDSVLVAPAQPLPLRLVTGSEAVDRVIVHAASFAGFCQESMTRGQGWRFLDIGRRIDRASHAIELLRHSLTVERRNERDWIQALLEITDCSLTYRSRYLTSLQADLAIDLLLIDEANPRSVAFQLARLAEHIELLPDAPAGGRRRIESRLALKLLTAVRVVPLDRLVPADGGNRPALEAMLTQISADLDELSAALTRSYLSHAGPAQPLG
ncbi:MAG: circularly permuted type 2 ATP-grasp protein [Bryobacterales bacterium]|nr:circularly permuted type 2 ATP-grasp protein [Bryobacterales bacterium]